jgi:hypothetical protein
LDNSVPSPLAWKVPSMQSPLACVRRKPGCTPS